MIVKREFLEKMMRVVNEMFSEMLVMVVLGFDRGVFR